MCTSIWLPEAEKEIQTIGELAALIGREKITIKGGYRKTDCLTDDRCCLCPVNLQYTARKNGYSCDPGDFDPMQYVWIKKASA